MLRNVHTTTADRFGRIVEQIRRIGERVQKHDDILRRETLRVKGYELEYRTTPTPGVYLVNKRDNDPNFGTATLLGQ